MWTETAGKLFKFICNFILWPFVLLIYTIPIISLLIIRLSINHFVTKWDPSLIVPSPNDILLVREAPNVQKNVNGGFILRVKGTVSIEEFKQQFWNKFLQPVSENFKFLRSQ